MNLVAIGLLVGSVIGPILNQALQVPPIYRVYAVVGFLVLVCWFRSSHDRRLDLVE